MAGTRRTQDRDVISRIADVGEDALRRLVDLPRRTVVGVMDGIGERLHDVATKLRSVDPLAHQVAALEKRLESLEKPKKSTARRASRRARPSTASGATTPAALAEPEQAAEPDRGAATTLKPRDESE
jgi:hypothetical protein